MHPMYSRAQACTGERNGISFAVAWLGGSCFGIICRKRWYSSDIIPCKEKAKKLKKTPRQRAFNVNDCGCKFTSLSHSFAGIASRSARRAWYSFCWPHFYWKWSDRASARAYARVCQMLHSINTTHKCNLLHARFFIRDALDIIHFSSFWHFICAFYEPFQWKSLQYIHINTSGFWLPYIGIACWALLGRRLLSIASDKTSWSRIKENRRRGRPKT